MTPVYKLSANSVKNGRTVYGSMLAGNTAYVLPSWYDSIATVTVGSGGASTMEFTSIPDTYTHLQIRFLVRSNAATTGGRNGRIRLNNTASDLYSVHYLAGDGASVFTDQDINLPGSYAFSMPDNNATSNSFGAVIIDILDYANTNKFKTIRSLSGFDLNGSGVVRFNSGLWRSTNAITSIQLAVWGDTANLVQNSTAALYGIKGA